MKLCGWCAQAPATTRYTSEEMAGMYVSVCAPCLAEEREAHRARIEAERAEAEKAEAK